MGAFEDVGVQSRPVTMKWRLSYVDPSQRIQVIFGKPLEAKKRQGIGFGGWSGAHGSVDTLILDFQFPGLGENKFLLL
jgi:hypothetical protein